MKGNKSLKLNSGKKGARVLYYLFAALLLVVLIFSIVVPGGNMNTYADDDPEYPTVSITEVKTSADSGHRTVLFSVTNAESASTQYTIYYRTQNGSGIAGKNFKAVDSSIVITAGTAEDDRTVDISLIDSTDATDTYGISTVTYLSHTLSSTRDFICEIYYAESNSKTIYDKSATNTDGTVLISSTNSRVTLQCKAPKVYLDMTEQKNKGKNSVYYYKETQWMNTSNNLSWSGSILKSYQGKAQSLANQTLSGVTVSSMSSDQSGFSYSSYPAIGYCYVPNNNYAFFQALGMKRYVWLETDGHTKNEQTDITIDLALYYLKSATGDVSVGNLVASGTTNRKPIYKRTNIIGTGITKDASGNTLTEINGNYAVALDYTSNYLLLAFQNEGGADDYTSWWVLTNAFALSRNTHTTNGSVNYIYYDNTAPTVVGYYVQPGTYGAGQNIRLSIKFSEPVRRATYNTNSIPSVTFGSSGKNGLTFDYVGGEGTDTLYFEATIDENSSLNITNLTDFGSNISLSNFYYITDFTYNSGNTSFDVQGNIIAGDVTTVNNTIGKNYGLDNTTVQKNSQTALVINTKAATISLDTSHSCFINYGDTTNTVAYSSATASSHAIYGVSVCLNLTNVSEGDYVYYVWKLSDDDAPTSKVDYTSSTQVVSQNDGLQATITNVDTNGIVLDGFTSGKYTLYVLYRSASFVTTTTSYNYTFDLDPPTVTYTAPTGYNINNPSQTVSFSVTNTSNITSVEYAVSTSPSETESTLSLTTLRSNVGLTYYNGSITVDEDTPNVTDGVAANYYIYVKVTDTNGKTSFVRTDFSVAVDLRSGQTIKDLFKTSLYCTAADPTADEFYDDELCQSMLTYYIDNVFYQSAGFTWYSVGVTWTYTLTYLASDATTAVTVTSTVDGSTNVSITGDFYSLNSYASSGTTGGMYYVIDFVYDGYYTIALTYEPISGSPVTYNTDVYVYGNEEGSGENYLELSDDTRYLVTKYWQLKETRYYLRDRDTGVLTSYTYVSRSGISGDSYPVFATYEEAYAYVLEIEKSDIQRVKITSDIVNSTSTYVADDVTMNVDDYWYIYKPSEWSSLSSDIYVYYYYGYDVANSNLYNAVHANVQKTVGTLTTDSYSYASYSDNANSDNGSVYINTNKASLSSAMYSSTITYDGKEMYLASAYKITADTSGTKVYYCEYGESASGISLYPTNYALCDYLTAGGAYEFYEIGKYGAIKYYVYVDATAPTLGINLTSGADAVTYWSYPDSTTTTLYGKSFTITGISDADDWTVLQVVSGRNTLLIQTLEEFEEVTFTDSGTYVIYVYDRSGNRTSITVVLESEEIAVTLPDADDSSYTFRITNRDSGTSGEIRKLEVYYKGDKVSTDEEGNSISSYPTTLTFYKSGIYKIVITDVYGYTYEQEIELYRSLPDVNIYVLVNGSYVDITTYPDYYTYNEDTHTYTILTPASLYIWWGSSASYTLEWLTEPDEDSYTYARPGISSRYYSYTITESTDAWVARIGYALDEAASIYIVADVDETPPVLSLVSDSGDGLTDGEKVNTQYVTISWAENESAMTSVSYTFGDTSYSISTSGAQTGSYTLGSTTSPLEEGTYVVTATNIMGLTSTFTFIIHTSIDVYVSTSDGLADYDQSTTVYQDEDNLILLTEEFYITIESSLYESNYTLVVSYSAESGIGFMIYDTTATYDEDNEPDYYTISADDLEAIADGGTYVNNDGYTAIYRTYFGVYVGKTSDGELYLGLRAIKESGENIYDVTLEEGDVTITLTFVICTDETDIVVRYSDGNDVIAFDSAGSFMYNKELYIAEADQNLADITYISYTYEDGEEAVIYDGTTFTETTFTDEGTYVITITNKYTAVTTRTIRIYDSIILDANVIYSDGTTLTTSSTTIYSNGSVQFVGISRTTYTVEDLNGLAIADFVFTLSEDGNSYIFTLSAAGTYNFTIRDQADNTRTFYVVITSPAELTLSDKETALSGWDTSALRADSLYTSTQVTLKSSFISDNNIGYVTYEYYEGQSADTTTLELTSSGVYLDKVTGSGTDLTANAIGWLGDGLYIIKMYDYSGNLVTYNSANYLAISYKGTSQLSLNRITQGEEEEEGYSTSLALTDGFYSNYELIFTVSSSYYLLTVNGTSVTATNGVYTIYPSALDVTYEEYAITYCDEYGNYMSFTAYILTEKPQVTYLTTDILVTIDSVTYAAGSPSFTATGTDVTAYYYKDSSATAVTYTLGEEISGDGEYLLYFVDIAGNVSTVSFVIDTEVDFNLATLVSTSSFSSSYSAIFSGAVATNTVRIAETSEDITIVSVTLNGEDISSNYSGTYSNSYTFTDNGEYAVVIADRVGNTQAISFTIVEDPVQEFTYTLPAGYVVLTLAYTESGYNVYVRSGENFTDGGIYLNGDHTWVVVMTSVATSEDYTFTVVTDTTAPEATFSGYAEVTKGTVTLTAVSEDSTVRVYKDGSLQSTYSASASSTLSIECSDYGTYRVVVTDLAGNVTEYDFTIQYTMSAITIAFITVVAVLIGSLIVFIVVIRKRVKIR